jgi:GntR family histidine utilization transcriptional repressor
LTTELRQTWREVRDRIRDDILDRTYRPGDKLPRDADIAEKLGCARSTVQRAMRDLSDAGLVERKRKGGTHVRTDPVTRATLDIPITRLEVEKMGSLYGYKLVDQSVCEIPSEIAVKFGQSERTKMMRIQAIHLANHKPHIFEDRWVSTETSPEICDIDLSKESANEWLVRNKPFTRCDLRFYAISADAQLAKKLATIEGSALFVIERTTWNGDDPITSVKAIAAPGYELLTSI